MITWFLHNITRTGGRWRWNNWCNSRPWLIDSSPMATIEFVWLGNDWFTTQHNEVVTITTFLLKVHFAAATTQGWPQLSQPRFVFLCCCRTLYTFTSICVNLPSSTFQLYIPHSKRMLQRFGIITATCRTTAAGNSRLGFTLLPHSHTQQDIFWLAQEITPSMWEI